MTFGTLLTQIRTAATTNGDLNTDIGGRIYFYEAPPRTNMPYIVYHYIANSSRETTGQSMLDSIVIQFSIFDDDPDAADCLDAKDKLVAVFDSKIIQSGSRAYKFTREYDDGPAKIGDVWQCNVQYRVMAAPA